GLRLHGGYGPLLPDLAGDLLGRRRVPGRPRARAVRDQARPYGDDPGSRTSRHPDRRDDPVRHGGDPRRRRSDRRRFLKVAARKEKAGTGAKAKRASRKASPLPSKTESADVSASVEVNVPTKTEEKKGE